LLYQANGGGNVVDLDAGGVLLAALALVFPVLLTLGAIADLRRYLIPNWISLVLAVLAVPALLLAGADLTAVFWHLTVGLAVLALMSILFFRGMIGGGDVKLIAAAACWTGWPLIIALIFYIAIAGGLLAVVLIIVRRIFRNRSVKSLWLSSLLDSKSGVPYGVAIAAGGWLVWGKLPVFSTGMLG
jgi:prepilin peptidase CpaA